MPTGFYLNISKIGSGLLLGYGKIVAKEGVCFCSSMAFYPAFYSFII